MTGRILEGRRYRWFIGSIVVSALCYLIVSVVGGWDEVAAAFALVGVKGIFVALALSLFNYGMRFVRWQHYLSALGHRIALVPSALIYIGGFALTTTPGKAGELLRGLLLRRYGVPYVNSTAAFFSERLSDVLAILLLGILGASLYPQGAAIVVVGALGLAIGFALLISGRTFSGIASSRRDGRFRRLLGHLSDLLNAARQCHRPLLFVQASFFGIIAWAAEAYAFYLVLQWMGWDTNFAFAFSVYAISMLAGAMSFLPGGLGGAEAVMIAALVWAGMPPAQAVAATIIIRLTTLWFAVGLGLLALSIGERVLLRDPQISTG